MFIYLLYCGSCPWLGSGAFFFFSLCVALRQVLSVCEMLAYPTVRTPRTALR